MRHWRFIAVVGIFFSVAVNAAQVGLIKINGAIGPATANYIARAIDVATAQHDECLIIRLDTPGGLLESTKEIVQTFYAAKIPTVVYVAPSGASAGSAGVFITLAADVAVMAPHSSIGAAHPVEIGANGGAEKIDDVMKRNRNVEWAKSAVVQSVATTAEKALDANVIDFIADDLPDLLKQLDGREFNGKTLKTVG